MKTALQLALISLMLCFPAGAKDYEYDTTLLCGTQEQVERYVSLFDGDVDNAINEVNAEEHNPNACALGTVAFLRGPKLTMARSKEKAFQIVQILIVGVSTPTGVRPVRPAAFFTLFEVLEYDV